MENFNLKQEIGKYTQRITEGICEVDDYINLILLYSDIAYDYGVELYCTTRKIYSQNEILQFPEKIDILFKESFALFPDNDELEFWKIYISEISAGTNCNNRIRIETLTTKHFLLPHFYLRVQCGVTNLEALSILKRELLLGKKDYRQFYLLGYLSLIK